MVPSLLLVLWVFLMTDVISLKQSDSNYSKAFCCVATFRFTPSVFKLAGASSSREICSSASVFLELLFGLHCLCCLQICRLIFLEMDMQLLAKRSFLTGLHDSHGDWSSALPCLAWWRLGCFIAFALKTVLSTIWCKSLHWWF